MKVTPIVAILRSHRERIKGPEESNVLAFTEPEMEKI
jgi:hypothetical protein